MAPAIKRRKLGHDVEHAQEPHLDDVSDHTTHPPSAPTKQNACLDAQVQSSAYTADSSKSNTFKLQIDELLKHVTPKYSKREASPEAAMRLLKSVIEQMPSRAPLPVPEAEAHLRAAGVTVPFPCPRPPVDTQYKLQFERPTSINATGSYPLRTATRTDQDPAIDLVVVMPKSVFQEKDYLNHRYFHKRAYYLACLAAGIQQSKEHSFLLAFDTLNGNQLQPILVVRPSGSGPTDFLDSKCHINILLAVPDDTFTKAKLFPQSNCVRPRSESEHATKKPLPPTPFYNSTLQSDAAVTSYLKLLHAASSKSDAFTEACILGRIWLKQRGFSGHLSKGGFGNFEWATISALLLQPNPVYGTPPLSPRYSSYQLFKATLQFLARHDLATKPYVSQPLDIDFPKSSISPLFFDASRGVNILYKMTPWSYSRLKFEAKLSIDMLSDPLFDQFDAAFILRADLSSYRYDSTLQLPLSSFGLEVTSDGNDAKLMEQTTKLYNTLVRALGDRVVTITLSIPETANWPINLPKPHDNQQKSMLVQFATDPANAYRTVDYGPSAENKQDAASFRKFWGEKAELRRFKDGSILESVVWSNKESSTPVLEQIILHTLRRHIGADVADNALFVTDPFARLISPGRIQDQSGIALFTPAMNAFAFVERMIRELKGLPLQVRHIRAADEQLRYASIEPPLGNPSSIVLQFEASARWPDDLCAIQRTKIAFLLKLAELVSAAHADIAARVGLENPSYPSRNQAYVELTTGSGFVFHLRIHHDREETLLERQLNDKLLDAKSRESAATALALYKRDFVHVLSYTQVIQNLCTRYAALSPAIRLTKKWFASHLLSPHFEPELIELLVVRTFLQPHPWPTPACATTGFLRTLAWISRWDWRHVPLIVDFSTSVNADSSNVDTGKMKPEDLEKVQTRFEAWRRIDPAMNRVVIFAATNIDTDGNTWSDRSNPEKVVATRMTTLAKAATAVVRAEDDRLLKTANGEAVLEQNFVPESLFVSSAKDYDFVLNVSTEYTNRATKKKAESNFRNLEVQELLNVANRPEQSLLPLYIKDLRNAYGDAVLLFWDPLSFSQIAGLWNPLVTAQRAFKVKAGWSSLPTHHPGEEDHAQNDNSVNIQFNTLAVLGEMKRLGGNLITSITTNR